jgi:hypothetical protein
MVPSVEMVRYRFEQERTEVTEFVGGIVSVFSVFSCSKGSALIIEQFLKSFKPAVTRRNRCVVGLLGHDFVKI